MLLLRIAHAVYVERLVACCRRLPKPCTVTGAGGRQGRVTLGLIVSCNFGLEVKNTVLSGSNQCCQLWPALIRACPVNEFMLVAKVG